MERKVLGRGLDSLIPADSTAAREKVQMLKTSQVQASRFQPRLNFSKEKLEELASSIREKGIIQPILVRQSGVDTFELIAGERRLRAAKHLGLTEVPAIVRRVSDADLLETSIIENIQREELNPLEEAKAYRRLGQEFGMSQDNIAQRVGKDKSTISNLLRILNLPEKIQTFLAENKISLGHAKALLAITDPKGQLGLCEKIVTRGLSVRQIEQLSSRRAKRIKGFIGGDPELKRLETKLEHALGTRVRIRHGKKRGRIEIDYFSLEDLDRVLALLGCRD